MSLFGDVLLYASELGLIGKEHFAIDGCKLPSNASKKWSGTHKELEEKREKLERVAERIVQRHRERDGQELRLLRGAREGPVLSAKGRRDQDLPGAEREKAWTDWQRAEEQSDGPRKRKDDFIAGCDSGLQRTGRRR